MTEELLFNLLKKLIPDLEKRNPMSYRDGYSPKYDLSIELKCREAHYNQLIIEKIKWDALFKEKNVRYINSTPKGIYSFDIKKIKEPEWFDKLLPASTHFDEDKRKIKKKVGLLDIKLANEITHLVYETKENTVLV